MESKTYVYLQRPVTAVALAKQLADFAAPNWSLSLMQDEESTDARWKMIPNTEELRAACAHTTIFLSLEPRRITLCLDGTYSSAAQELIYKMVRHLQTHIGLPLTRGCCPPSF